MARNRKQIWVAPEFKDWLDELKEDENDSYRRVSKRLWKKCKRIVW